MSDEETSDGEETTVVTVGEEEEEESQEDPDEETPPETVQPKVIKQLKPDPEDDLLRREATVRCNLDWIEETNDPEYEQPHLTADLAKFIKSGYEKLGRKLGQDMMGEGLSMVAKAISGLSHAFVKLDLPGKAITEIVLLGSFCNLRYVSLAGNHLFDIKPLNELQFLMTLDLSDNYLESLADFQVHSHLKTLNVSKNFLKSLRGVIEHPYLQRLYLSYNKISHFVTNNLKYLKKLETLELRKNRLVTFGEIDLKLPSLKHLFLAQNSIETFAPFRTARNLEFLDLRRNKIKSVGDWAIPSLKYLNLSFNYIEDIQGLERLAVRLPQLITLAVTNNPLMVNEKIQNAIVVAFRLLTRFNAVQIDKQTRLDAAAELAEEDEGGGSA